MSVITVSSSDFRANMPKYVGMALEKNVPIVVMKHSRPWFEVRPAEGVQDMADILPASKSEVVRAVQEVSARYPSLERVYLFGSFARDAQTADSDVDLRVEFEQGESFSLADLSHYSKEIEQLTKRQVDVVTARTIKNKQLEDAIERDKVLIYER